MDMIIRQNIESNDKAGILNIENVREQRDTYPPRKARSSKRKRMRRVRLVGVARLLVEHGTNTGSATQDTLL